MFYLLYIKNIYNILKKLYKIYLYIKLFKYKFYIDKINFLSYKINIYRVFKLLILFIR